MVIPMLYGPRDLRLEERPLDTQHLKPDEIWVETEISALKIGTDRGNYEGAEQVPGAPDYPRWVGDSNLGVVRGAGSGVKRFRVGDRVVAALAHQSEYVASEAGRIVRVPDGVHRPIHPAPLCIPEHLCQRLVGPARHAQVCFIAKLAICAGIAPENTRAQDCRPWHLAVDMQIVGQRTVKATPDRIDGVLHPERQDVSRQFISKLSPPASWAE